MVYATFAVLMLSNLLMYPSCIITTPDVFLPAQGFPEQLLMGFIAVLCILGSYGSRGNLFDVFVTVFMGIAAISCAAWNFPLPPLVIGLVLGQQFEMSIGQMMLFRATIRGWPSFPRPPSRWCSSGWPSCSSSSLKSRVQGAAREAVMPARFRPDGPQSVTEKESRMIRQMMKKTLLFLCVFMLRATGALAAYPDHPIRWSSRSARAAARTSRPVCWRG